MGSAFRQAARARGSVLAILLVAAGAGGAAAQPRQLPPSREPCYQYNPADRVLDAQTCTDRANDGRQPRQYTIYANFNAGRAYRVAGNFAAAELALNDVVNFRPQPLGPKPTPADLRFELTRTEAEMELARLYQSQPGRKADAATHASNAISGYSNYYNNATYTAYRDEALRGRIDATLLLADIQTQMPPANKVAAFEALALRGLFLDQSLDAGPPTLVQAGRQRLKDYATDLGNAQFDGNDLSAAAAYFDVALKAARLLQARDPSLDITDAYINLGKVSLKRAGGIEGPYVAGGCDPRGGDYGQLDGAARLFAAAGESDTALLWKGCALMASGNLSGALESFAAASRPNNPYPEMSLARAYFQRARTPQGSLQDWNSARTAFQRALAILDRQGADPGVRAGVRGELAGVDIALVRGSAPSPARTALVREARTHLTAATQLLAQAPQLSGEQALMFLRLAEIQIGDEPFNDAAGRGDVAAARDNIGVALRRAGGPGQRSILANGNFLLSKLEARQGNWPAAIHSADEAVSIGGELSNVFRAQACDMRLLSRPRRLSGGEQYCKALHNTTDLDDALLREGLYYLSVGTLANGRTAHQAWNDAYRAFDSGANALPPFSGPGQFTAQDLLKARLLAGKGLAMICTGLSGVGADTINNDIPAELRADAREYFGGYGIRC